MVKGKSGKVVLDHRQSVVKPLVDDYFDWVKKTLDTTVLDKASKTYKALTYSLHQEEYLREFLSNPIIPMDNNDAERNIRSFCVGKHNWKLGEIIARYQWFTVYNITVSICTVYVKCCLCLRLGLHPARCKKHCC